MDETSKTDNRREWLIWNADYHQFWGPNRGGYFGLWGAGLYTEAEARDLSANKDRRDQAHHITEYRDQINNMRGAWDRLNDVLVRADVASRDERAPSLKSARTNQRRRSGEA